MKKIYVMAAFLGATSFAFNQVIQEAPMQVSVNTDKVISTNNTSVKALGTPLWEDGFDDPTTWTINNDGKAGKAVGWTISSEYDGWTSWGGDFSSTSGGNFAEVGNGTDPNSV